MTMTPEQAPTEMDASQGSAETGNDTNLRIARSERFESFLTDALDQPLYMFAGDVAGKNESGCLGDCAREWPPFDVEVAKLAPGIDPADVSRFHRQDGAWQTRYKGHPLYYRGSEAGGTEVGSDGTDNRWFVARDYFTFLATARTFAPAGGTGTSSTFLTDGYGRTLYVCLDDRPAMGMIDAFSSCEGDCTRERPLFVASEGDQTAVLPSTLVATDIGQLHRLDGRVQLTYRGWPLYYFSADITAGATAGHNERAWRAIDPSSFGREPGSTN